VLSQLTIGESEGLESPRRLFMSQASKSGVFAAFKQLRHPETSIENHKLNFSSSLEVA